MKIVIVGAGFTGIQLAKLLVNEKNDVIIIENNEEIARHVSNQLDCNVIVADGNSLETLEEAGISGKKRTGKVDPLAAAFILQGYLDSKGF